MNTTAPQPKMVVSSTRFQFQTSIVKSVSPSFGPASGGTLVSVEETILDIGNLVILKMTKFIMIIATVVIYMFLHITFK